MLNVREDKLYFMIKITIVTSILTHQYICSKIEIHLIHVNHIELKKSLQITRTITEKSLHM